MNPVIVIPSYWSGDQAGLTSPGAYDHTTDLVGQRPELDRCLASLEQVRKLPRVIVLLVCPQAELARTEARVRDIIDQHPSVEVTLITNREASAIMKRVSELAPKASGETVSLRGYGAIRNMGLACAAILGHNAVVFLDDDEVVLSSDFMERALYGLGNETRQRLPILAKSGYFYDKAGSPLADTTKKAGITCRWWTKRIEFNRWMEKALAGTRISRSNYVCGGCFAVHARAFSRVAFDPYITRGEDLDYLFNMRLFGLDVWFDNAWAVKHLPPAQAEESPRFMQNVYRWYYERAKLAVASRKPEYNSVTAAALMPYPGPWISGGLDERVRKTALARAFFTREHRGYWHIWRHGIGEAQEYAREHERDYLRFVSFWPSIIDGLRGDKRLAALLERA
ncbi:glycosyltransferase family 2 protein [Collinsella provencensis]|uniref:glycosyltransferase family 2 protein n=1 Tax=Collinsella provencensis TaxID=1937461 RepID=UPI000C867B2E|nr:glycosyltransferase [Collinsella provencensis]